MNIAATLLLTVNIWASFFCCCHEAHCGHEMTEPAAAREMGVVSQGPEEQNTPAMPCHGNKKTAHTSVDPWNVPQAVKTCGCAQHQSASPMILMPKVEAETLNSPVLLVLAVWLTAATVPARSRENMRPPPDFLVSARFAPNLSLLSRFLI